MFTSLSPGAIGVKVDGLQQGLSLAAKHGFAGYHFGIGEAHELGVSQVRELSEAAGVRLSAFGFPLDFRSDEAAFEQDLAALPALAETAVGLDVKRTATWITPASDELNFADNLAFHARRLQPAAAILAAHDIRLGLEYVGPKTSRDGKKHEFVHTMDQMSDLCAAVGDNCGYLLDAWHWYTAHEDASHLQRLSPEQVVDVHVNDAPEGAVDEQLDNRRCLPGETGVIDIATFLGSLKQIGYDGPVMVEPFSQTVRDMDADAACAATGTALSKVWAQAGLA
ncbi:MAG: sugar phosphate isomerase/epimerase family protein [Candidatus Latescibacteria bacterium]|jgi:sugar phosphate isomerase/epimerase|nr:xylose isomerase [Gemmatimonadaceae bacterium]MDP6016634.1 sugar phosphate isomerase/epimerase family protein [Candidatus Latescibacterota bacterium]